MRRVVFASDDPRLETRGEAVRSIVDAALRIARDGVDNLVSFDELAAFPERFQDVLERPSTSRSTVVYADVATAAQKVGALAMLTGLAQDYAVAKRRVGVIDFSDQVAGAYDIVRSHPSVADEVRDRFRVVLLDEYQDTSVVQTDLLAALFGRSAVMAVGDPHQAIYGWRGASAGNLGGFSAAFSPESPCAQYPLLTSWRNSTRVLDAANAVLAPLAASSPVPVQGLRARPGAPAGEVGFCFERDLDAEADRVAEWFGQVRQQRAQEGSATTGAILFRSKKHMVRFGDALGRRGIPHRILGLGGLLSTPEVVDVVSALRVISDPSAGSALIRLLAGPRWAIGLPDLRELAQLARRIARHDSALRPLPPEVVESLRGSAGDDGGSLVDALDFVLRHQADHGWLAAFTPSARERLREAAAVFAGLRQAVGMPLPELVRLIELELRLDIELAANDTRGPARIASAQLRAFVDELHAFLAADETGSLSSLLAWLDHAEQLDEFAPRTEPPEEDVVQLLTIHGSKGLEWDAVAVVRLVTDELPSLPRDTRGWLGFGILPYEFRGDACWLPELRWQRHVAPTQQDLKAAMDEFIAANRTRQLEEDRRLAYVAVTRARDHLLLTGSSWSGTRKARDRSPFFTEMADALGRPATPDEPGEDPYLGAQTRAAVADGSPGCPARRSGARRDRGRFGVAVPLPDPDPDRRLAAGRSAPTGGGRHSTRRRRGSRHPVQGLRRRLRRRGRATRPPGSGAALPPDPARHAVPRVGGAARPGTPGAAVADDALWEMPTRRSPADRGFARGCRSLDRPARRSCAPSGRSCAPIEVETEIDFTARRGATTGPASWCASSTPCTAAETGPIEIVDWKTGAAPRRRGGDARSGCCSSSSTGRPTTRATASRSTRSTSRCTTSLTTWCCAPERQRWNLVGAPVAERCLGCPLGVRFRPALFGSDQRRDVDRRGRGLVRRHDTRRNSHRGCCAGAAGDGCGISAAGSSSAPSVVTQRDSSSGS